MRIRKRLQINVAALVVMAFAIAFILSLSLLRINKAGDSERIAGELMTCMLERATFKDDYLRNHVSRAKEQWFAKHGQIRELLGAVVERLQDGEERRMVEEMIEDNDSTGNIFTTVVTNRESRALKPESERPSSELEDRLLNQLNVKTYEGIVNGRLLLESIRKTRAFSIRVAGWGIIAILVALIAVAVTISRITIRSIADRAGRLREGASVIGSGNLDHRIDIRGDDEFAEVAEEFNTMSSRLRSTYRRLEAEVAERKLAEEDLRRSERRYRSFVEVTSQFAWVTDPNGLVVEDVPALRNFTGQTYEQARGAGWASALHPEDAEDTLEIWRSAVSTRSVYEIEYRMKRHDGVYRLMKARGVPILDDEGKVVEWVGTCIDITEPRLAREALQKTHAELQDHARRLQETNRELEGFAYTISHDLRAPLRAINGFARMLSDDYGLSLEEEGRRRLEVIGKNAVKMGLLIDDLLAFSRAGRTAMNVTGIDMNRLVAEVVETLKGSGAGAKADILVAALPAVRGDYALMRQVLTNLLENALKFSRNRPDPRIEVGSFERDGEEVYYVRDNGVGFDMKYKEKLFGVFQRLVTEKEFEGTGVGLAIVQRLVARHGGRVWAESRPGEGASFFFTLRQRQHPT